MYWKSYAAGNLAAAALSSATACALAKPAPFFFIPMPAWKKLRSSWGFMIQPISPGILKAKQEKAPPVTEEGNANRFPSY